MSSVTLIITQGQQGADAGADQGEQDVVALARRPPGEHQAAVTRFILTRFVFSNHCFLDLYSY